jgi:hypothetical protein
MDKIRFVLSSWHLLPQYENQLNVLIRYLNDNQKINIVFNSYAPQNSASDVLNITNGNITAQEASVYLISNGIDSKRVTCAHLAESNIPMFRFIKGA